MAILTVKERITTGDGSGQMDENTGLVTNQVNRVFSVMTDGATDQETDIINNIALPWLGQPHPSSFGYFVIKRDVKRIAPRYWEATYTYTDEPPAPQSGGGGGSNGLDPDKFIPEISWDYDWRKVPVGVQWQTKYVNTGTQVEWQFQAVGAVNSAHEPFTNPPVTYDKPDPVLTYTRYEPVSPIQVAQQYTGCVNNDMFLGAAPQKVKVVISAKRVAIKGNLWWHTTYKFSFRDIGWQPTALDYGSYYIDGSDIKSFTDKDGNLLAGGLLDGNGGKLPLGQNPVWLTFAVIPSQPFNQLQIQAF